MATLDFSSRVLLEIGPIRITETVVSTWVLMAVLVLIARLSTRHLRLEPAPWQVGLEGVFGAIEEAISAVLPNDADRVLPFIATLWIFIVCANVIGVVPELRGPTDDLSLTAALAVLVFLSVHYFGIRSDGLKAYLQHYLRPNPILLPFHIVSEISRSLALAVRLFGNVFSLEIAALLILLVAGFLVPIPLLALHLVEGLVQAYIFGMLALIYIAGGIQSMRRSGRELEKERGKP